MAAAGHTVTDAAAHIGCDLGALGRVLSGKRGAGMDLAVRIEAAYPTVVVRSWTERADEGEKVAEIPRGKRKMNVAKRLANANNDNEGRVPRTKHGAHAAQKLARKVNRAAVREEKRRALKEGAS